MNTENLSDSDMQNATAALIRAGKRAKKLAEQTGTEFVVIRNGKLVREIPKPVSQKNSEKSKNID